MKKILISFAVLIVIATASFTFLHKPSTSADTATTTSPNASQATLGTQSSGTPASTTNSGTIYNLATVAKHASKSDCWTIVNGSVYNITSYVPVHPGGVAEIVRACGVDSTDLFNSIMQHGRRADSELASLKIGVLN